MSEERNLEPLILVTTCVATLGVVILLATLVNWSSQFSDWAPILVFLGFFALLFGYAVIEDFKERRARSSLN